MVQQIAVEWLFEQFTTWKQSDENRTWTKVLEQAKQMEKEQIVDAFDMGCQDEDRIGEEYYNDIFGGQGSPDTIISPNTHTEK